VHEADGCLFEYAGAHAAFDVLATAHFEDHDIEACLVQQMREKQSRRTRTDDPHLNLHRPLRRRAAIAKIVCNTY
jgi:hypothetical protein